MTNRRTRAPEPISLIRCARAGQKDYDAAFTHFQKALQCDPDNGHYARGIQVFRSTTGMD